MEVHHHPHVGKKTFKEYIFEFLMIFLAVTMGFFAENIRESVADHEKQIQYLQSLSEDLKIDTERISYLIRYDLEKVLVLNKMDACYDNVLQDLQCTGCMGPLIKYSKTNRAFQSNDRTLTQLANAGGFRLLGKEAANGILAYESLYRQYENFQTTLFQEAQDNVRNTLNLMANFKVNEPFQTAATMQGTDSTQSTMNRPLLFSNDRAMLNKWFNELAVYRRVINAQITQLDVLKQKATDLIEYYRKHHQLE